MGKFFLGLGFLLSTFSVNAEAFSWQEQAKYFLYKNISPDDTHPGCVVASPSRSHPDYWYHWTRDAALVMSVVVDHFKNAKDLDKDVLEAKLIDYMQFSNFNQMVGGLTGLGEPKYNVEGDPFMGPWGRPQNDGPALRAMTFIKWARLLLKQGQKDFVKEFLYRAEIPANTLIKRDLEYVSHHWREASFDLWEEVQGDHFYTRWVQRASMIQGAWIADQMGDPEAAAWYKKQGEIIEKEMAKFWNPEAGIIVATINRNAGIDYKNSGLDVAVILGVLHGDIGSGEFTAKSDKVLSTAFHLKRVFKQIYEVNQNTSQEIGVGIGRYPEDRYDGYETDKLGNPWFLATYALGELAYRASLELIKDKKVAITTLSLPYYQSLVPEIVLQEGDIYEVGTEEFQMILSGLLKEGDRQIKRGTTHANQQIGAMSEQFSRKSGFMQGAVHLTWSYASLLSAFSWRAGAIEKFKRQRDF